MSELQEAMDTIEQAELRQWREGAWSCNPGPTILSATDIREEGIYWWRPNCKHEWNTVKISQYQHNEYVLYFNGNGTKLTHLPKSHEFAQFVGPIPSPPQ